MIKNLEDIDALLDRHNKYRDSCLNLIASENVASQRVLDYLSNDFNNRYGCYATLKLEDREYTGNKYIHEFEYATHELVKEVFGGKYVDLRPISGHMAGMAVVLGILDTGDTVVEVALEDWGHGLVGPMCQIGQFEKTINVKYMTFNKNREVDLDALIEQVREVKPKLVIFGGSGTLFFEPVKEFRKVADELGIVVAYDAAHVTGLIAGGVMPNPINEGADIMFGSTHKSFPGPQGGFIVANTKEHIEKIGNAISPSLVTSHHLNRLPAFAASLLEMQRYGNEYSKQVVKNAKALAIALNKKGFNVQGADRGFTDTHLLLVELGEFCKLAPAKLLEKANILCSDDFSGASPEIRVGTPEITRRGVKEDKMEFIADLFERVLMKKEDTDKVAKDVAEFSRQYLGTEYSFK